MTVCVIMKYWNEEQLLPVNLRQWYDVKIDAIHLYNGGCTDNSVEIVEKLTKNLKCKVELFNQEKPHKEYLKNCKELEWIQLNRMNEEASEYDWIIHNDVDEIFNTNIRYLVENLNKVSGDGIYVKRYNVVGGLSTYVTKVYNMDYPFHSDMQLRIYKSGKFHYPKIDGDTFPHPVYKETTAGHISGMNVIHLHDLFPNRRSIRDKKVSKSDQGMDRYNHLSDTRNTFATINRFEIPDHLMEWYNSINTDDII